MKTTTLKNTIFMLSSVCLLASCNPFDIESMIDPNNPSVASVNSNATPQQIQYLVTGLESRHRDYVSNVTNGWASLGREIWLLNSSDTRNMTEWLGLNDYTLNSNVFGYGTTGGGSYSSPYGAINQANLILDALANTDKMNETEKAAVSGFAKTIMGYQYMIPANWLYQNGIRVDVKDELNPGPFVSYDEALTYIKGQLDAGFEDLKKAGTTLPFKLSTGFSGYNNPAGLAKVNRAISARLAIYRKDWQGALDALSGSFIAENGNLEEGPKHTFSSGADLNNPLFMALNIPNPGNLRVVNPGLIADATPGDSRVAKKFFKLTTPFVVTTSTVALTGEYQDNRYPTNTLPVTFIKNEELILIKAEAQAQLGQTTNAIASIDIIREAANIGKYTGPTDKNSLLKEILYQRRYSLWAEPAGHRWVDVRRYTGPGLLYANMSEAIDATYDKGKVFTQFPLPQAEVNWDLYKNK